MHHMASGSSYEVRLEELISQTGIDLAMSHRFEQDRSTFHIITESVPKENNL